MTRDKNLSFDDVLNLIIEPNYLYNTFLHPEAPTFTEYPKQNVSEPQELPSESQELTADDLRKAVEYLKEQSDKFWSDPYGNTCGLGFPHVISPSVYKNGGYTLCSNCGEILKVEPHG